MLNTTTEQGGSILKSEDFRFDSESNCIANEVVKILSFDDSNMEAIDTTYLYQLGLKLQLLSYLKEGDIFEDVYQNIHEPAEMLFVFVQSPKFQLSLCLPAAQELLKSLSPFIEVRTITGFGVPLGGTEPEEYQYDDLITGNLKSKLTKTRVVKIRTSYRNFEAVLFAELRKKHIYIIPPVRAYSIDVLLDNAKSAFSPKLLEFIPDNCIENFQSAGRALSLNLPLGMSFHLFLALEIMLKEYGQSLGIINSELKESDRNWGNYLNHEKFSKARDGVVSFLKQIKDSYRNPLIHADAKLDSDEAPALFSLTQGTVELIAKLVKESKKS
ncbi:MAG TPA: hypothetical protein VFO76_00480 [Candidatus Kapabacteria bacterium]|nr:hypothetical protein [Candidatus Kapabacteria bacterium]